MTKLRETLETITSTADCRLYVLACDAYKAGTPRDLVRTVRGNSDLLMALVVYYLENRVAPDMRGDVLVSAGAGQMAGADDGHEPLAGPSGTPIKKAEKRQPGDPVPPTSTVSPGGGQLKAATDGHSSVATTRRKPNPPRGRDVIRAVNRTLFDTYKVRNGKAIGDLTFGEARTLADTNDREARVLRVVCAHVAFNAEPGAPIRDLVPLDLIERAIAQSLEASDGDR